MNMVCFAGTIEGLFFFAAFAYVYFFTLQGFTQWSQQVGRIGFSAMRAAIYFAFEVVRTAVQEQPELMDNRMRDMIKVMVQDAIDVEMKFADDILEHELLD